MISVLPRPFNSRTIKRRADFLAIASRYTQLHRNGSQWRGLCPFHAESNPSFYVESVQRIWKCFGCGRGGDLFALVMLAEGCDFPTALRIVSGVAAEGEARRAERFRGGVGAKPLSPAKPGTQPSRDSRAELLARLDATERRCVGIQKANEAALAELATACERGGEAALLLVNKRTTGHE